MSSKKDLRIVFMGTPDFAVTILKKLVEESFNVVGVVTAPDKPAGRGRKLKSSAVKMYAENQNLHILQPTNLKNESFLQELASLQADLQIVVAFRMLPKAVWSLPVYGTFNLHASLLPDYRGAAPIHWAIINGETKTGATTFFIDDKIDTGEIILTKGTTITEDETVGSLHDKLMHLGADLVTETATAIINGGVTTTKQPSKAPKLAPKLTPENTKIDWNRPTKQVYDFIRGLNPFPAAWTSIQNGEEETTAKLYKVTMDLEDKTIAPGTIIQSKTKLGVATSDGFIYIHEMKVAGKKKMVIRDLLNGYHFEEGSKML
ncbi:MAG: methionyl-tRNA formyltransferase [Polaribacter sp.]